MPRPIIPQKAGVLCAKMGSDLKQLSELLVRNTELLPMQACGPQGPPSRPHAEEYFRQFMPLRHLFNAPHLI